MAIAAATASLACLEASSIAAADGVGFVDCRTFADCAARGPLFVAAGAGGMNDFWLTVNGTAGVTRFDLGPDGAPFATAAKDVGAAVVGALVLTCSAGVRASETGGLESTGGVDTFCGGAGVALLLAAFAGALSSTGSSDVGFGGGGGPGGGWCC